MYDLNEAILINRTYFWDPSLMMNLTSAEA